MIGKGSGRPHIYNGQSRSAKSISGTHAKIVVASGHIVRNKSSNSRTKGITANSSGHSCRPFTAGIIPDYRRKGRIEICTDSRRRIVSNTNCQSRASGCKFRNIPFVVYGLCRIVGQRRYFVHNSHEIIITIGRSRIGNTNWIVSGISHGKHHFAPATANSSSQCAQAIGFDIAQCASARNGRNPEIVVSQTQQTLGQVERSAYHRRSGQYKILGAVDSKVVECCGRASANGLHRGAFQYNGAACRNETAVVNKIAGQ
ncbi:MAG: hypothetical protein BWX77_00888 [Bacteroidetes bacterium ADurb.Bin090]|nr:MAG: hypothetical protein BWX77_00888 [Bacteroidetes bacterium ADurb.Bin090]